MQAYGKLLDVFFSECELCLGAIGDALEALDKDPADADALSQLARRAHTIAGNAAMMNMDGVAQLARGIEESGQDAGASGEGLDRIAQARTLLVIETLRAMLARTREQLAVAGASAPTPEIQGAEAVGSA